MRWLERSKLQDRPARSGRAVLRVLAALIAGMACAGGVVLAAMNSVRQGLSREGVLLVLAVSAMSAIPCSVTLLVYFAIFRSGIADPSPETRCRKCGYILRGITEPRCPECGERI